MGLIGGDKHEDWCEFIWDIQLVDVLMVVDK